MGRALIGDFVGLTQHDEDRWLICFGPVLLAERITDLFAIMILGLWGLIFIPFGWVLIVVTLGVIAVVFLAAITTSLTSAGIVDEIYTASSLAQTQMEDIKGQPYSDANSYGVTVTPSGDYSVSITVVDDSPELNPDTLQRVTVTISRSGLRVFRLESYKAKL